MALVQGYYSDKNFKILTPYDAQRNEIERALKVSRSLKLEPEQTLDLILSVCATSMGGSSIQWQALNLTLAIVSTS